MYFVSYLFIPSSGCFLFKREEKRLHCVIYFGGKIALKNHFYIACITFHYLPRFATKTYAKSHSAPQTPSCVGHAYSVCKGLWPLLFPNSLLNAGCFSFLANALSYLPILFDDNTDILAASLLISYCSFFISNLIINCHDFIIH